MTQKKIFFLIWDWALLRFFPLPQQLQSESAPPAPPLHPPQGGAQPRGGLSTLEGMCVGWRRPAVTSWGPCKTSHTPPRPPPSWAAGFKSRSPGDPRKESAGDWDPHHLLGLPPCKTASLMARLSLLCLLTWIRPRDFLLDTLGCSVPALKRK